MSWQEYVTRISGGEVNRVIAAKIGVTEPSVARWKSGATKAPDAKQAAAFARAYSRPVLEAFVAAEFLTSKEAQEHPSAAPALDSFSDDQLVEEIQRRLRERGEHGGDTAATRQPLRAVAHGGDQDDAEKVDEIARRKRAEAERELHGNALGDLDD